MLDPRRGSRCTAGMVTLHHPAYDHRDFPVHSADTPVFHAVEQRLHAGWLFDPRLPAPGPGIRRSAPRHRHAKVSRPMQTGT